MLGHRTRVSKLRVEIVPNTFCYEHVTKLEICDSEIGKFKNMRKLNFTFLNKKNGSKRNEYTTYPKLRDAQKQCH